MEEVNILAKLYDDIKLTERLQNQIEEGLEDIKQGRVHDFDKVLVDTRLKYGL